MQPQKFHGDDRVYCLAPKLYSIDELVQPFMSVPQCHCITCTGAALRSRPVIAATGAAAEYEYVPCPNMSAWLEGAADTCTRGGMR